jgi:hypothetical protein
MLVSDPKNYEPQPEMSITVARLKGFADFTFYPTLEDAKQASYDKCVRDSKLRTTIVFDEIVNAGGESYVLHVLGETPRPRPVIKTVATCLQSAADRLYRGGLNPQEYAKHNPKLDAFAIFMGEWAAKIKNAVTR